LLVISKSKVLFLFFAEDTVRRSFHCKLEDFPAVDRHYEPLEYFNFRVSNQ